MARAKKRKWKVAPGDVVSVTWLDSGTSDKGDPDAERPTYLVTPTTHGRVVKCEDDKELNLPRGWSTETLILITCGAGEKDLSSELAAIWVPSIIELTNHGPVTHGSK